jgi:hypothetical protein
VVCETHAAMLVRGFVPLSLTAVAYDIVAVSLQTISPAQKRGIGIGVHTRAGVSDDQSASR